MLKKDNKKYKNTIGGRLKKLREDAGLTQDEMGDIVGYTRQNIGKIEDSDDENNPIKTQSVLKYAKHFNVSTDYILGLDGDHKQKTTAELGKPLGLNEKSVKALWSLNRFNPDEYGADPFYDLQNGIKDDLSYALKTVNVLLNRLYSDLEKAKKEGNDSGQFYVSSLFTDIYKFLFAVNIGFGNDPRTKVNHFIYHDEQPSATEQIYFMQYDDRGITDYSHVTDLFRAYYEKRIVSDLRKLCKPYDKELGQKKANEELDRIIVQNRSKESKEIKGGKNDGKHTAKRK